MPASITRPVFFHDFLNPPSEDRSCNIDIRIIDAAGAFTLTKEASGSQTRYNLSVADSSLIGLSSTNQQSVDLAIKDLVLAINLVLSRTCMSTMGGDLHQTEVNLIPAPTKVTIEESSNEKKVNIMETAFLRETYHITIGTLEDLSEQKALSHIAPIAKVKRFSPDTALIKETNLGKALREYENAMLSFDRLRIFKSLFNSLEFCTNWTGAELTGASLDTAISAESGELQSDVSLWRELYNRTKHVDRALSDASSYVQGIEKLLDFLPKVRKAAQLMVVSRLSRV